MSSFIVKNIRTNILFAIKCDFNKNTDVELLSVKNDFGSKSQFIKQNCLRLKKLHRVDFISLWENNENWFWL